MSTTNSPFRPVSVVAGPAELQAWLLGGLSAAWAAGKVIAALPFDTWRTNHASAVKAGLIENSMLASRDFEQLVATLERLSLGPLARRV